MTRLQYELHLFDSNKAKSGALCIMIKRGTTGPVYNIDNEGNPNEDVKGVGVCKFVSPDSFILTINGVQYPFDLSGNPKAAISQNYVLMLGTVIGGGATTQVGNTSRSMTVATTTKQEDGTIITEVSYVDAGEDEKEINVSSLNSRDHFALQALQGILHNIEDPCAVSDSEMNYYCNAAYQWAANMIAVAANTRAEYKDKTAGGTTSPSEDISLETNTDKLLNNIIVAIETLYSNGSDSPTIFRKIYEKLSEINSSLQDIASAIRG